MEGENKVDYTIVCGVGTVLEIRKKTGDGPYDFDLIVGVIEREDLSW